MPFADPEDRRRYDRERKRSLRLAKDQAPLAVPVSTRIAVAADIQRLLGTAVELVMTDDKAKGTEKARALGYLCTVGLRLLEARDIANRLEALEDVLRMRSSSAS